MEYTYKKEPDHGKLRLTKVIAGDTAGKKAEDHISFTVTNKKTGESDKYKLDSFKYNEETGIYYLNLDLEVGTYVVKESASEIPGAELAGITVSVNGGDAQNGASCEVKVVQDKTTKVAYTDTYRRKETSTTTTTTTTTTETTKKTTTTTLTKTGDDAPLGLWLLLLLGSGAGIAVCAVLLKKRKNDMGES